MSENQKNNNAQDFFLYLLTFLALTFLALGAGSVLFQAVNKFLPDEISNNFDQGGVRFGIAAILIAGPLFLLISRFINQRIVSGVTSLEAGVRKWLTYIVLFFAAATVIGDLITLVLNFLGGETTVQFLLKVLIILVIAGGIFAYYFWDMRKTKLSEKALKINKLSAIILVVFSAVVFVGAFFLIDSPATARLKRIDSQTISDVQSVDSSIRGFFTQAGKLPKTLADLDKTGFSPYLQSANEVEYAAVDENTYKLCATFERADIEDKDVYYGGEDLNQWKHAAGEVCFERIALDENAKSLPAKLN
jgi:hypothetical protein